jgi:ATP-binding cassette subfamily B protein
MANKSINHQGESRGKSISSSGMGRRGPGGGHHLLTAQKVRAKDTKGTLKRIWSYMRSQKLGLFVSLILVAVSTLLGLLGPYFIALAIDKFIAFGIRDGFGRLLALMMAVYVAAAIITLLQQYILINVSQKVIRQMRKDFFDKLLDNSLKFFDSIPNGELMSRLTNDIENVSTTLSQNVAQLFSSVLSFIGVVAVMLYLNWQLAIVTMLTIPLIMWAVKMIGKHTRAGYRDQQKYLGELNGIIEETLTGQKVVKVYGKEEKAIQDFDAKNQQLKSASIKAEIFGGFMGPSMNMINNLRFAIIAGTGGFLVLNDLMTVGLIAAFLNYSKHFGRPLTQLANVYNTVQGAIAGAERVFETMDHVAEVQDVEDAIALETIEGHVVFDQVNFSYTPDKQVLKGAGFEANPGDTIAIVGPTGAGKTTIINLLTRFYDIDSGQIEIDGIQIKDIQKNSLRRKLGIVLQDTYLFSGTVRENIRYGRLDASDEEVEEAAKRAYADHFIKHLPHSYDAMLSQDGSNLSQGQRQLIAIARAILSDPAILILDEATSSVDTRTEVHIQKAMLELMKGRTSFVIAHRLSTIKDASQILVINEGEIIERGNHETLLAQKGFYYNLHMSQYKNVVPA